MDVLEAGRCIIVTGVTTDTNDHSAALVQSKLDSTGSGGSDGKRVV